MPREYIFVDPSGDTSMAFADSDAHARCIAQQRGAKMVLTVSEWDRAGHQGQCLMLEG